jgi:hypothetical protein
MAATQPESHPESFTEYKSSTSMWSPTWFRKVLFLRSTALELPNIERAGFVQSWEFTKEVPASAQATVIVPGEVVPCLDDIAGILRDWECAFNDGYRGILVTFSDGMQKLLHYQKVRH